MCAKKNPSFSVCVCVCVWGGGVMKNKYTGGYLKGRGFKNFRFKGRVGKKECSGVLGEGWYPSTLYALAYKWIQISSSWLQLFVQTDSNCHRGVIICEKIKPSEEGGTHLRISVWHLLIYLKNNYLFEKLADMIQ